MENGKLGFMGKRVVNEEEFFTQIQRLRSALPKSMKDAEDLMKKAEAVVKSAQGEADRLIDNAEREAERIVTDARTRSERALAEAKAHSERTVGEAKAQAERLGTESKAQAERAVAEARAHAERVTTDADNFAARTVEDANAKAQKAIDEANERAARAEEGAAKRAAEMVAENEITLRATEEGETARQTAQNDADEMRRNADDYAYEVLDKVAAVLTKLGLSVEAGKGALRAPAYSNGTNGANGNGEYAAAEGATNGYSNGHRG